MKNQQQNQEGLVVGTIIFKTISDTYAVVAYNDKTKQSITLDYFLTKEDAERAANLLGSFIAFASAFADDTDDKKAETYHIKAIINTLAKNSKKVLKRI